MSRRGTTLIEVLLTVILTSLIIGAVAAMYAFATARAAHTLANQNSCEQSTRLMDAIETTVRNAVFCDIVTVSGQPALRCTMPAMGTDTNGDGFYESFNVQGVGRRGTDKWGTGQRVWFYLSDSTGVLGVAGTVPWRAKRNDAAVITSSDVDTKWTYPYGGVQPAFGQITSLTFSVSSTWHDVTVTAVANTLTRSTRTPTTSETAMSDGSTMKRIIYWRNWRQ